MHGLTIYKTNARICLSLHFVFYYQIQNVNKNGHAGYWVTSLLLQNMSVAVAVWIQYAANYWNINTNSEKWKLKAKLARSDEFDQGNGTALFADFQSGHVTILHATLFINAGRVGACAAALIHSQLRNNSRHRTRHLISTTGVRRYLTALDYSQWNLL